MMSRYYLVDMQTGYWSWLKVFLEKKVVDWLFGSWSFVRKHLLSYGYIDTQVYRTWFPLMNSV